MERISEYRLKKLIEEAKKLDFEVKETPRTVAIYLPGHEKYENSIIVHKSGYFVVYKDDKPICKDEVVEFFSGPGILGVVGRFNVGYLKCIIPEGSVVGFGNAVCERKEFFTEEHLIRSRW